MEQESNYNSNSQNPDEKKAELSFGDIIEFLLIYKKPIIYVTLAAGVIAFIFSLPFFIPPKFKSSVIIYPPKTSSISKSLLGIYSDQQDITAFGEEEACEQLLQILESDVIAEKIAKEFNLPEHYGIKKDDPYPQTKLKAYFKDNVTFKRTEYMSVEISVLDGDKKLAADMANSIANLLDTVKADIQKQRAVQALRIVENRYKEKTDEVKQLTDSLEKLGEMGVTNYEEQSSVITEQYARALMSGQKDVAKELKGQERILAKYGPIHQKLKDQLKNEVYQLTEIENKLALARIDAEQSISQKFTINKAVPGEKKAYPLRLLIIGIAMLSAFASSILVLAVYNNYKNFKFRSSLTK